MSNKKIKVGIFTHNYPITSTERKDAGIFVYDFAHELYKNAEVFIFCPDFGGKKEKYKNIPVTWMDWGGPKIKFGNWPFYSPVSVLNFFKLIFTGSRKAEEFVRLNKIDYVLACWTMPSSIYALWTNIRLKIPYSVWVLGSDVNIYAKFPILRQLTVLALRKAHNRFSNSYWLISATEKLSGKKCNFMSAITNFKDSNIKPQNLSKNVFNFLSVGRLEKVKGPDVLIKACLELKKRDSNFLLHMLGDGTMKNDLVEFVNKHGLNENVKLYGNSSKDEIISFMKSAQSHVITSRAESIPLVMVESARFGLPTIATNVGDCKYAINKYNIGIVARSEDPVDIAKKMYQAMREGSNFKKNRQKGLKRISDDYKQEIPVGTFLKELDSI